MKLFTIKFALIALIATTILPSCSKDNTEPEEVIKKTTGVYILNSGKMGNNNASLSYYDFTSKKVTANLFASLNGKKIGDTGNDMIIYGGKMYIGATNSSIIFVTDLNGKLIKEITVMGEKANLSPRHFTTGDGKVYVSYFEGYVGQIDTTNFSVNSVKVGALPEGIIYVGGKVYVANSDGYNYPYGTTVSVLNASTMKVIKEITVSNNPQTFHLDSEGDLYLISWGDYGKIPASLQKINLATYEVTPIKDVVPTNMAIGKDNKAYIISSVYDANWKQTIKYYLFDTKTDTVVKEFVSSDIVKNGYCIFTDPTNGYVYIGCSDYVSNGDMYLFMPDGTFVEKFDTGGLNPIKVCYLAK
jgi:hypothetical protein